MITFCNIGEGWGDEDRVSHEKMNDDHFHRVDENLESYSFTREQTKQTDFH